jgi:shikimate dehydrogenase
MVTENKKNKRICGIIGDPLKHSLSPVMHNMAFSKLKLDFKYHVFEIKEDQLIQTLDTLKFKNFRGLNVTHPFKLKIMDYLDFIDENAKDVGCVNTIVNNSGNLSGYNTDSEGAISALTKSGVDLEAKNNILILGAGGAARAVSHPLAKMGNHVFIANRSHSHALEICKKLGQFVHVKAVKNEDIPDVIDDMNILINCTPLGMLGGPKGSFISHDLIDSHLTVFDMVYNPKITPLLKAAIKKSARIIYGHEMFVLQGALAFELWTKKKAPLDIMQKTVLERLKDS